MFKIQEGRLYLFYIRFNDLDLYKVGITFSDRSTDRLMEVLRDIFNKYRFVPYSRILRDKKVYIPRIVERYMHIELDEYRYTFDKKFDGSTEFFTGLDKEYLLDLYDNFDYIHLLRGITKLDDKNYNIIKSLVREDVDDNLPF